jgi:hypothetical protein
MVSCWDATFQHNIGVFDDIVSNANQHGHIPGTIKSAAASTNNDQHPSTNSCMDTSLLNSAITRPVNDKANMPRHLPVRTTHSLLLSKQPILHPHVAHVDALGIMRPAQRVGGRGVFFVVAEEAADGVGDGHRSGSADNAVEDD